ncbi:MAG: UDP-3-O-acyl-N-acetylglucosamine deacetylase [Alphaproteobacteria bacterium]|nr:UDP-3-O-acyl-N-acetylglucosamine deacetylase [Alphaproteobacteria bacterium]
MIQSSGMQKTLKAPIHCRGIGLHSGAHIEMVLRPAAPDTGIRFYRSDLNTEIAADWRNAVDSPLCTTLANAKGVSVGTVEHLMAAFAGLEVDNAVVELDGPEIPAMDGSASPFVFLIECAGLVGQDAPRRVIRVLKPITVGTPGQSAALVPNDRFSVSFAIDFTSSAIRRQELTLSPCPATFKHELCAARTFGFLDEVERMREAGLARGGSLDNAVVIAGDRVLNEEGLRYDDEFVRHKMLDALGDLYLAGAPLLGHFHGTRSGHALNRQLLAALFADRSAWRFGSAELPAAAVA